MNLQPLLTQYLLEHGSLPLTGAGQLSIVTKPAVVRENDAIVEPPRFSITFLGEELTKGASQQLSDFIGQQLSVSQQEVSQLLAVAGNLQTAFAGNGQIDWPPFGHLEKKENGTIVFQQDATLSAYLPDILIQQQRLLAEPEPVAETTEEAIETVSAGEPTAEWTEPAARKNFWWVWAIVILVVSMLLIMFRYFG